jgi:large subunit ribosomal protein L6
VAGGGRREESQNRESVVSRVGKQPIELPAGVEVKVNGRDVIVKGAKGELSYTIPPETDVALEGSTLTVTRRGETRQCRAFHGLARARLANAVKGVHEGFSKTLEIQGTGFRAEVKGGKLEMQLGFSHPVIFEPPKGIDCTCTSPTKITVSGIDKVLVGQVAADIRKSRPPEPYKGKGIRYEGEHVRRKAGKSGAAAGV